jgi:hypothetical protein
MSQQPDYDWYGHHGPWQTETDLYGITRERLGASA